MPITTTPTEQAPYTAATNPHADHLATDHRTAIRFAWRPVRLTTGRWCWLRRYLAHDVLEPDYSGWSTGQWVEVEAHPVTPS